MALSLLASNNAQTVLSSGISSTATTLTVNTGTGSLFPSPVSGVSFFKLTLIDAATGTLTEIVHVTQRSGDTMTIVRGQEGTSSRIWSANDIAANMMTAGTLSYVIDNFAPIESPALTGTPTAPTAAAGTNTIQLATTAFVQSAKGAMNGANIVTTTPTTLTASSFGQFIEYTGASAGAITVPTPVGYAGYGYKIWNNSANQLTLTTPAGTFIGPNGSSATTLSINAGSSITIISDGSSFAAIDGSGTASKTSNGKLIMPNGMILQWGNATTTSGQVNVSFPIAFPNACLAGFAGEYAASSWTPSFFTIYGVASRTTTTMNIRGVNYNGGTWSATSTALQWQAIGY